MAWNKSRYSNHPGTAADVLHESVRVFEAVTSTDPSDMFAHYGHRYDSLIQETLLDADGIPTDEYSASIIKEGIKDTIRVVQTAFTLGRLTGTSLHDRIAITNHPISVISLGILAARNEECKDIAIGDYPGGDPSVTLDTSRSFLVTDLQPQTGKRVCPYGGEKPAPIFMKFAKWAGTYAVHADDPSYRRRTGENS